MVNSWLFFSFLIIFFTKWRKFATKKISALGEPALTLVQWGKTPKLIFWLLPWNIVRNIPFLSEGQCSTQIKHFYWCKSWNHLQGLYTRSHGWNRKKTFSICPKLLIGRCQTLWPCIGPKPEKKGYHQIWEANFQLLGPMFQHLLISWHQCSNIY